MLNNMYGNCQEIHPRPQRQRQLFELYMQYLPDALGLQECNPASRSGIYGIDTLLSANGYAEALPSVLSKSSNYTPVFYRTATVTLIECGWEKYNDGKGDNSKSFTWAVLELKSTGERFAVFSTHFWWKSIDVSDTEARVKDATQILAAIGYVNTKYPGIPVIAGGDLNCNSSSQPYAKLISGGLTAATSLAEKVENLKTHHSYPEYNTDLAIYDKYTFPSGGNDKSIDHILIANKNLVEVKLYDVVTDPYSLLSTDHCPIILISK